jgi:DNA replication protein DnaC
MMERAEILATMADLKLFGMRAAYDELMATTVRRQHEPQRAVGDLLDTEINEKKARSVNTRSPLPSCPSPGIARSLPSMKHRSTKTLVRDLARGEFLSRQRSVVLIGGTGTGKAHISVGIARAIILNGARGRFFNVVDLVKKLEASCCSTWVSKLHEQTSIIVTTR